jgi:hypothetical protein
MYKIKTIEKTCFACPSQWEGFLENGKAIYIRYRWGYLSIRISDDVTDDIYDAVCGKEIYGKQIGEEYDGVIELDTVLDLSKGVLEYA